MSHAEPPRIFVLIDALGWSYVRDQQFLRGLLPYQVPVRTVLGFSSAAIPTILTGLPPERHGHWNLFYYNPSGSPFRWLRPFHVLPDRALNSRIARRAVTEIGRRALGLGPLFDCSVNPRLLPWFDWIEKRNIFASGGISGASSFFDEVRQRDVACRVYTYRNLRDDEILREATKDARSGEYGILFLYLSELDGFLHKHCGSRRDWTAALARYEAGLRVLFEKALDRDPRATFAVFSDHGMTPVRGRRNIAGEIRRLGFRMPEDYLAVYDSTMARYWFFSERAREGIAHRLSELGGGRILTDDELRSCGVFFDDRRYGQLIYLLDPGWLLGDSDFHTGAWKPAGMHGYHPDDPDSDGAFLANSEPASSIRSVADVYSYLKHASFGSADHARME
jgi:predicted AlkP superfamily pyrophosphatase or phosphodiesterase